MNLLITGAWRCSQDELNALKKLGHTILFMQNEKDELPCPYESVEGVICNGLFLYHDIEKFTALSYIQLTSAGFDRVPMEKIAGRGIVLHNARGVYSVPMAEFALCGVLDLYKQSRYFYENQNKGFGKNTVGFWNCLEKRCVSSVAVTSGRNARNASPRLGVRRSASICIQGKIARTRKCTL